MYKKNNSNRNKFSKKDYKDKKSDSKNDNKEFNSKKDYKDLRYKKQKSSDKNAGNSKEIRLNRYIASAGICSRREADNYIKAGVVKVNGKVVKELGTKILPTDKVTFNDQRIKSQNLVYVLLNKPKDYITTLDDPHAKKKITDLVKDCCHERIYPVGRLDRYTTGVYRG
jgi:23S rRNA pseudouridine2605 synthase